MAHMPRDKSLDSTLALLRDGYVFIPNRCARYGARAGGETDTLLAG
jgi:fatty-acid peroxygenase